VRYGPRVIDLDILFYDDLHLDSPDLIIPHPGLAERDFVLQPLCDINAELRHPVLGQSVQALWQALGAELLPKVMPIGGQLWTWANKTYIMGIVNMTPDSFSGDGLVQSGEATEAMVEMAIAQARRFVAEGADCLLELIRRLGELTAWGFSILVGPSRKGFIGKVLGDLPREERLEGTLSACVLGIERGANILRVHDVRVVARAARFTDAVLGQKPNHRITAPAIDNPVATARQ
jgi:hypothetical protein